MMRFGMFNSVNGDRKYKAEDFARYFSTFIGNGVYINPSDCLQIIAVQNTMKVIVRPGKAWINGYYLINDDDYTLTLNKSDTSLNRIDRIVVRLDYTQRKMSVEIKKGTLSNSPIAPTLKRDADAYELALADVYIGRGSLTISQANITDQRLNKNLCGLMHNPVYQVDTTSIFNQYQAWFNLYSSTKSQEFEDWKNSQQMDFGNWRNNEELLYYAWAEGRKNSFDAWFATIVDILDSNAAGNLLLLIDDHKDAAMPHKFKSGNKDYKYGWRVDNGNLKFLYEEV